MPSSYSEDLRRRVLAAYDRGDQTKQVAERLQVSPAWARRVKQRRNQHGEVKPRPRGGAREIKIDRVALERLVRQRPDATLAELRQRLGVSCALSALHKVLNTMAFSFKKRRSMPPSRSGPTSRRRGPHGGSGRERSTRRG